MSLSQEDIDFLKARGIDPSQIVEQSDEPMSQGRAIGSTLKAHTGGILGGGAGTLIGAALAPETFGASLLLPIVGGLAGGYGGQKLQQAALPADVEQHLQEEEEQAKLEHPYTTLATDVTAGALASGGKFSPGALIRGLKGDMSALGNIALQSGLNTAIDTGVNLATTGKLPGWHDVLGDVAGGALFSEPSALGRLAHHSSSEPLPEPTADLTVEPPVTDQTLGPLKMAPTEPIPTNALPPAKTKDTTTQNTMDQTKVSVNPIDKKAATESPLAIAPDGTLAKPTPPPTEEKSDLEGMVLNATRERLEYSPEDLETYNNAKRRMADTFDQTASPEFRKAWQDFEDVRNKYGGMPPKVPDVTTEVKAPLTESNIRNPIALAQHIQSGTATTGSVLQHLTETIHHPYSDLAQHLLKIADSQSLKTPWGTAPSIERSQYMFSPDKDRVVVSPRGLGDARVTIEEALHSLTSQKLPPEFNKVQGAELLNRMNRYLQEGTNPAVKDLIRAYTKAAEHLGLHDMMFRDVNEAGVEFKGAGGHADLMHDIGANDAQKSVFYAMGNLHEFLAHAFKNEQFQRLLNEMPSGAEGKSVWQKIVDSVKRLLGMDVNTGSMLDHVLRTSSDIVSQERPKLNGKEGAFEANAPKDDKDYHMGRVGRFTRDVISRVHDIPREDAKYVADAAKRTLNEQDRLQGQLRNSTVEAGSRLTPADREMINKVRDMENTTKALHRNVLDSDAQRNYYDTVKKNLSDSGDMSIKMGMPVASDKGPRPLKKDPTYWPSMSNQKVQDIYRSGDLAKIAELDKKFDDWNQKTVGLTPKGSAEVIRDYKTSIQGSVKNSDVSHQDYFKAFRRAMGTPIPPEFREPNPVRNDARYFDRASIALSHYKYMESDPKVMSTLGATHDAWGKTITPNPDGSLANNPQVRSLLDQFKGDHTGNDTEKSFSSLLSSALISGPALEMHKLVSNEVKAASFSDNPYQLVRAVGHAMTNIKSGYRHAVENGLTKLSASSTLDMFNGALSSAQRLNGLSKLIRDVSTLGGLTTKANLGFLQSYFEYLVPSKIQRANAGDNTAQMFLRRLDPTYAKGKTYTPQESQQLASLASSYVHGTGDIRTMPAWMMNDSEVSGFFKLAHWSVAQTNNFMHDVWTPAQKGDLKPLVTSVFGATIGGYIIKQLREEIQGKKSGIPSLTEIANSDRGVEGNVWPLAYNAIAAMQYSGFGGLLSQVAKYPFDFVYKNMPQGATFPLDQIATDLAKTVGQVTTAIATDPNLNWVDLAKAVTGHVLQNDMQLSRIAINQGINAGLISGLPAEKKQLADKMGDLRRFDMVEGLPYNDIEPAANPYMNIEQQKFKHTQDINQAITMLPTLVTNIIDRYQAHPDVMLSKLKALKENQYETMPSLETMPIQFMKYMSYVQKTKGDEAAEDLVRDFMTHKIVNQAKASVVP